MTGDEPKMECSECGLKTCGETCPFCERVEDVLSDAPDADDITEFWEAAAQ